MSVQSIKYLIITVWITHLHGKNCGGYVQVSVDQQEFISEFSLICHQFIRHNSQYQYYNVQVPMNVQLICHTR